MIVGTVLAEIFTPQFVRWMVSRLLARANGSDRALDPNSAAGANFLLYVGGVVSAVLLSHRLFLFPAFGPLLYNVLIIVGGVIGGCRFGIAALAYGALVGSMVGPFLASVIGAVRIGTGLSSVVRRRQSCLPRMGEAFDPANAWGVAGHGRRLDQRHFMPLGGIGDIARLNSCQAGFFGGGADRGPRAGHRMASLPFFARLFNEKRPKEFAATVNDSIYRVSAASLLATGWMMAAAFPLIDLLYRRGRFLVSDTQTTTAVHFFWFSLSLALWSAQGLYARAFYASATTRLLLWPQSL